PTPMSRLKDTPETQKTDAAPHNAAHEFTGLALLALGLVLFLSLISYTPQDIPGWFPFQTASVPSNSAHTLNFLGILGALIAWGTYSLLGGAAYLLCAMLLGYGSAKLILPGTYLSRRALWSISFVLSGACLAQILDLPLIDARRLQLPGEGGLVGKILGDFLRNLLGVLGALVVLGGVYAASILYMTGIRPAEVVYGLLSLPPLAFRAFTAWRLARAEERAAKLAQQEVTTEQTPHFIATPQEALPSNERRRSTTRPVAPEPEAAKIIPADMEEDAKEVEPVTLLPAQAAEIALPVNDPQPAPQPSRPAPQIIDSTAPAKPKPRDLMKEKEHTVLSPVDCPGYQLPALDLLDPIDLSDREAADPMELRALQDTVIETLQQFGIEVAAGDITRGPTITRYEVYPAKGVRVDRIVALERDLARATRAERINILAPIPGKDTVGIEIANAKKQKVTLRELFESEDFSSAKAKIPIALGKDVYGKTIVADLAAMPHGLVAGTTGSGKSVCINAIIASILYRFTPDELRFIMIDPKVVEMQMYNALPHLVVPVVTDPKKVLLALRWAVDEMEKRYAIFAKTGVRNIASFNARPKPKSQKELDEERQKLQPELFSEPTPAVPIANAALTAADLPAALLDPDSPAPDLEPLVENVAEGHAEDPDLESQKEAIEPDVEALSSEERITKMTTVKVPRDKEPVIPDRMSYIVIIVDELADLMQTAPADVESAIARITQKARAAGIHMIIATQTPRADVITGVIKANVPCRMAFQVASALDSRVILDENGAERLLGQGDMLYRPPGTARMIRAQGVLVTDDEVRRLVDFAAAQGAPAFEGAIHAKLESGGDGEDEVSDEDQELVESCIEIMRQEKKASTSLFQRRLRLGYTRAARILDILETRGYVGPGEGAKPREILVDLDAI
ncbi:MAG: DNA translocase FtsK, partial [Verrucomicrobiota bacterium]